MPTRHIPAQARTYTKRLIFIGLAVSLGFLAICALVLKEMHDRVYDQARQSATNVISTISADINRSIELYDLSLQAVVDGMKLPEITQVSPSVRQFILFDRAATASDLGSIQVTDSQGDTILDSRTLSPRHYNHAGHDYFKVHIFNPAQEAYLSQPWKDGDGEFVIAISRRLTDANGSFAGVVVGTMRLSYFHGLFKNVTTQNGDSISLARVGGSMVMRLPYDPSFILRDVSASAIYKDTLAKDEGYFERVAALDGVNRLFVFKRVGAHPLVLSYGLSIDTIYARWRQEAIGVSLMIGLLCLVNIGLVLFLARALRREAVAKQELETLATTDALTGLCNRRRFDEIYETEWRRAVRHQTSLSVIMLDADHFKSYNDTFGHYAGDVALTAIANCIGKSTRRGGDLAARYGGEEFIVLLPNTTTEQALEVAEKIRTTVLAHREQQEGESNMTPTVSLGVASMIPGRNNSSRELYQQADEALYAAKDLGRNRVCASTAIELGKTRSGTAARAA